MQVRDYNPSSGDFPQGDLCIFPIPEHIKLGPNAHEVAPIAGRLILQEGEVSGHHHAITLQRTREFRQDTAQIGDPTLNVRDTKLRRHFGGGKAEKVGTAKLYRDPQAIEALRRAGEVTRTDLAVGLLVVEGGPVVLQHDEHDGIRIPPGNYYVGRQIESAGAEERIVKD